MNGIWSEFAEEGLKEMLYADKIMNTEKYKELKDVGNKIAKKYLSTKDRQNMPEINVKAPIV